MALWVVTADRETNRVVLTYFETASSPPKHCGAGDLSLQADIEAFAGDQATAWDRLETPHGTFVRQGGAFVRA